MSLPRLCIPALVATLAMSAPAAAHPAINAFNKWCFKAGQTEAQATANIKPDGENLWLNFYDASLESHPLDAKPSVERRCEVLFPGDHTATAVTALQKQMKTPPVFGTTIPLPQTHQPHDTTAFIEGRELLRGRVAIVEVGTRTWLGTKHTYMAVDRLYAGLGLPD